MADASHPLRGDIFWVDFSPARGSEQQGVRPAVVISTNSFNRVMPVVVVAAVTSNVSRPALCVILPEGRPLPRASAVMPFQVVSIDKARLREYCGSLNGDQVSDLEQKMRLCWGL